MWVAYCELNCDVTAVVRWFFGTLVRWVARTFGTDVLAYVWRIIRRYRHRNDSIQAILFWLRCVLFAGVRAQALCTQLDIVAPDEWKWTKRIALRIIATSHLDDGINVWRAFFLWAAAANENVCDYGFSIFHCFSERMMRKKRHFRAHKWERSVGDGNIVITAWTRAQMANTDILH